MYRPGDYVWINPGDGQVTQHVGVVKEWSKGNALGFWTVHIPYLDDTRQVSPFSLQPVMPDHNISLLHRGYHFLKL